MFTFNFIVSNSYELKYFISLAKYNCYLNSPEEALAIYKKRLNPLVVSLSKPSAILEDIDTLAWLIWSLKPKSALKSLLTLVML